MSKRTRQNILIAIVLVAALVVIRLLLGTRTFIYLSSKDIDHVDITVTPPGISATSTGDDTAALVKLLGKAVVYLPSKEMPSGQSVSLTLYKHDGTQTQVLVCGNYLEVDGKGYHTRAADGEAIAQWAQTFAESQNTAQ